MYIKSQEGKSEKSLEDEFGFEEEDPTSGEAALRGAGQGLTIGFLDELKAMLGTSGASPSEIVAQPELAAEKEREMFQQYEQQLAEERVIDEAMKKAQPEAYMAGELTGGIVPGLATGGASAAGGVLKEGTKQAMKQAAKIGAGYGAVSGAGYSEADNPLDLAVDTAVGTGSGAAIGGALPLGVKGIKQAYKGVKGLGNATLDIIPKSDQIAAAFNFGKQGKSLDKNVIKEELQSIGKSIVKNIEKKKKDNRLDEVIEQLDDLGYRVDTKKAIEEAVEDVQKLADGDLMGQQNKDFLPRLQELLGKDKQTAKLLNSAEKKALKKALESQSKAEQAIIKGEKALAKEQIKSGDSLETITDIDRPMNDLDLPLDTQDGVIGGVKGKFKNADGTERIVSKLDDVTPFQAEISNKVGPDRRPVVMTKDAGSGKLEALVGDINTKVQKDLSQMKISDVELLRSQLNDATKLAAGQGSKNDPVVQRAMDLAVELKKLTDAAVKAGGDETLINRRAVFSDIFTGEELLGINKKLSIRNDTDRLLKEIQVGEQLGFEKNFKGDSKMDLAKKMLGDDVITPEIDSQLELLKKVNQIAGRGESGENISRAGLYEMAAGKIPNLAGRSIKKVSDATSKITSPVTKTTKIIAEMGDDRLNQVATNMIESGSDGTIMLGNRLMDALGMKGQGKNAAIWALSQNPAFRSLVDRQVEDFTNEMKEDLGMESNLSMEEEFGFEEDLGPVDDNKSMMYAEDDTSEEEFKDIGRSPDSVEKIKQREGYAAKLGNKFTKYTGLIGTKNTRVEGSNSDYGLYYDSEGKLTSGIGDLVESEDQVESLKNQTKESAEAKLQENIKLKNKLGHADLKESGVDVDNLPSHVLDALENANFQLGSMAEFPALKEGLRSGDYNKAATESFTTKGTGTDASDWVKQTPVRVRDFVEAIADDPKVFEEFNLLNTRDEFDFSPEEIEQRKKESGEAEREVDRVNQQQSSGDMSPISQLDSLLEKINNMSISQDDKDTLEDKAIEMEGHSDGNRLKEMIRKLNGLS